jgi:hypothetical protein
MHGRNLDIFLGEVGVIIHAMLLTHLKKFVVNATGGLVISKDLSKYQEAVDRWKVKVVNERFEMLRELGNIFLVRPAILRVIIHEGHLAKLDYEAIKPFLMMREDWLSSKIEKELLLEEEPESGAMGAGMEF